MLKQCDRSMFLENLNTGDLGIILADNFFSTVQNWLRLKLGNPKRASHAFILTDPPILTEANGARASEAKIGKYVGDKTKCWIFRFKPITVDQQKGIQDFAKGIVEGGSPYAIASIIQFGLLYLGIQKKVHDEAGMFCSELAVSALRNEDIPICDDNPSYSITPSSLLSWCFSSDASLRNWVLSSLWDGINYYIEKES